MAGNLTKLEKIKEFNKQHADKVDENTQQLQQDVQADKTNSQVIKEKSKEKQLTAEEIAAEQERIKEEERQKQIDTLQQLTDATSSIVDLVNARVNPVKDWLASQPTPGGIAALLIFIGFMALFTIPVNKQGQTRAYLIWQTLMTRTHMKYREDMAPGGSSGNFGGGPGFNTSPVNGNGATAAPLDITHLNILGLQ